MTGKLLRKRCPRQSCREGGARKDKAVSVELASWLHHPRCTLLFMLVVGAHKRRMSGMQKHPRVKSRRIHILRFIRFRTVVGKVLV